MVKIHPVKKLSGYNMSLYEEVRHLRVPVEQVRKMYGTVGVDIFEGRTPSILSENELKKSKKLINRIKAWWAGSNIFDYEQGDRLRDVILKYAHNKQIGKIEEIRELFGDSGVNELNLMHHMGYFV